MTSRKKFKIGDPSHESALAELLHDVIDGENSDLDIDVDDEDDDLSYVPDNNNHDDSEDEDTDSEVENTSRSGRVPTPPAPSPATPGTSSERRVYWKTTTVFEPLTPAPDFVPPEQPVVNLPPRDYFSKYIPSDIYTKIAFYSNQCHIVRTGQSLNTNEREIRTFFGITMMMSYLRYPRIHMYWEQRTRVPGIAEKMSRDRYFKLRTCLKIVNDSEVTELEKSQTKFWKVRPLITCVRNGCLLNTPTPDVSVDEQMIPFWGHHEARQMVKGKPNPVGLKNFVLCCSNGLPLDFFVYEGKGDSILVDEDCDHQSLDIGGKVVVRLSSRLPPGCSIYMDRYFTSIPLLDVLHFKAECTGTGTLQKRRIPGNCNFKTDGQLRREGRGSYSQKVMSTGQIAAVKWFDNKPVVMASSIHGAEPSNECRRWDKKQKRYIMIQRPDMIKQYNEKMGGVDLLDRMMSYYRISARTRKWTIRMMFHFFDFAAAAGWIEYRTDQQKLGTPRRDILDCLGFREQIVENLVDFNPESDEDDFTDHTYSLGPPNKRAKQQHPSDTVRTRKVDHLPVVLESKNRCRFPGCRSNAARHQCPTCRVILCLVSGRNCYNSYHNI